MGSSSCACELFLLVQHCINLYTGLKKATQYIYISRFCDEKCNLHNKFCILAPHLSLSDRDNNFVEIFRSSLHSSSTRNRCVCISSNGIRLRIAIIANHMKSFAKLAKCTIFQIQRKMFQFSDIFGAQARHTYTRNLEVGYRVIHLLLDQGAGHAEMVMGRVQLISFMVKFKLSSC